MPVAHHKSLSGPNELRGEPLPVVLSMSLFDQIIDHMDKVKFWQNIKIQDSHKIEKLEKSIEAARQTIARAEEKRDALLKKNELLKTSLEHMETRQTQALKYWQSYGLDIKQVHTKQEGCEEYEFIYSKLSDKSKEQINDEGFSCSIGVLHQNNNLQVVSQKPLLMNEEQIAELNSKLIDQCIESNGRVNYKSAMILIKKALGENMSSFSQHRLNSPPDHNVEGS